MSNEVLIALFAFAGSLVATLSGILVSNSLTNHRLKALERKQDRHNSMVERTYVLEEKVKVANNRIKNLEEAQK
jgi:flagellar motor component MotA